MLPWMTDALQRGSPGGNSCFNKYTIRALALARFYILRAANAKPEIIAVITVAIFILCKLIEKTHAPYDENKKGTDSRLMSLGLQLPSGQPVYGSIGIPS